MQEVCGSRGNTKKTFPRPSRKEEDDTDTFDEYDESNSPYRLKILGGKAAKSKSWPWHVSLFNKFFRKICYFLTNIY